MAQNSIHTLHKYKRNQYLIDPSLLFLMIKLPS